MILNDVMFKYACLPYHVVIANAASKRSIKMTRYQSQRVKRYLNKVEGGERKYGTA